MLLFLLILLPEVGFRVYACMAVVSVDESCALLDHDEPIGARTPSTPPVEDSLSPSPRPHPAVNVQLPTSVALHRPVSIPDMVRNIAG